MEQVSQHPFEDIFPVMRCMCTFYTSSDAAIVAVGNSSKGTADFVTSKITGGFVVTTRCSFSDVS